MHKFNTKRAVCAFALVCICSLFTAWIGGIEPFTAPAGWLSAITLFIAVGIAESQGSGDAQPDQGSEQ